jgi:CheY-like chemotaxis protein
MKDKRKVIIVDDDLYFLQYAKERLIDDGFDALAASTVSEAKQLISENQDAVAIVLDIHMLPDGESDFETHMGHRSGLVLARWVKQNFPNIAIIGISGMSSLDSMEWFERYKIPFFDKGSDGFIEELNGILSKEDRIKHINTFIVHGHDDVAKYELKNYLQNRLKLPEPIILHEQPSLGRTIIEKFEDIVHHVDLVFVLLTPDDDVHEPSALDELKRRARQNVIFEMGYFLGKLQRRKGKVLLLYKGPLELPSDILGIIYIDISQGIEAAGELIRKELSFLL